MRRFRTFSIISCFLFILLSAGCGLHDKDPDSNIVPCNPVCSSGKAIELISPVGGETFYQGDTVPVQWRVNCDSLRPGLVVVQVSVGGDSGPWRELFSRPQYTPDTTGCFCMDTVWVVGEEWNSIPYGTSDSVAVRVVEYGHLREVEAASGIIFIEKRKSGRVGGGAGFSKR